MNINVLQRIITKISYTTFQNGAYSKSNVFKLYNSTYFIFLKRLQNYTKYCNIVRIVAEEIKTMPEMKIKKAGNFIPAFLFLWRTKQ